MITPPVSTFLLTDVTGKYQTKLLLAEQTVARFSAKIARLSDKKHLLLIQCLFHLLLSQEIFIGNEHGK
jgi:hypothetical protein